MVDQSFCARCGFAVKAAQGLVTALAVALFASDAGADSPLFSVDISSAYSQVAAVQHATEQGLDAQTCAVLADASVPSDVRAAVVQTASKRELTTGPLALEFLRCLGERHGKAPRDLTESDLGTHELFALGYLLALDPDKPLPALDDQNPTLSSASSELLHARAPDILATVEKKDPGDFTLALIAALARGNQVMSEDFCQVWKEVDSVQQRGLKVNLRQPALDNVLEYISLYKQDCVEKEARSTAKKLEPLRTVQSKGTSWMSFDSQGRILAGSNQDTAVRVFSSRDGSLIKKLDTGQFTDPPQWLDGGLLLAFGDWKPSLHVYDGTSFEEIVSAPLPARATSIALVQDPGGAAAGKLIAAGLFDGQIAFYALDTGKQVRSFPAHDKYVSSIVVTDDGKLVTGSFDASVAVYSVDGKKASRTPWTAGTFVKRAGSTLLVRDFGDQWRLFDPAAGRALGSPVAVQATLHDVAMRPGPEPVVAAALSSGVVAFYDPSSGKKVADLRAHDDQVLSVDFTADGNTMLTGSTDGTFRLWDVKQVLAGPRNSGIR